MVARSRTVRSLSGVSDLSRTSGRSAFAMKGFLLGLSAGLPGHCPSSLVERFAGGRISTLEPGPGARDGAERCSRSASAVLIGCPV